MIFEAKLMPVTGWLTLMTLTECETCLCQITN